PVLEIPGSQNGRKGRYSMTRPCGTERPALPISVPARNTGGGSLMRDNSRIPQNGARSSVLISRLVRGFIWRHAHRIALAFLCMGLAGGSTALRAWLMEPVLDRIFIARESAPLLLLAGAALILPLVQG